jgi:hypothetical protein
MSLLASCVQSNSAGYYFPLASASGLGATASAGVTQIVAGAGISVTPSSGVGAVTITNIGVVSLTASTGITNSGTATAPILAASVPTGSNITTYFADSVIAYTTAVAPPNTAVPLATITLPIAANYVQAIWGANPFNVSVNPEIVAAGVDTTAPVYIYLSPSNSAFNSAVSFGAFQSFPGNGTGEATTKLPSTAGVAGRVAPAVMSAKAAAAQTTYYMMLQNGNNSSNVYINASTSTSQALQVVAQVVST